MTYEIVNKLRSYFISASMKKQTEPSDEISLDFDKTWDGGKRRSRQRTGKKIRRSSCVKRSKRRSKRRKSKSRRRSTRRKSKSRQSSMRRKSKSSKSRRKK